MLRFYLPPGGPHDTHSLTYICYPTAIMWFTILLQFFLLTYLLRLVHGLSTAILSHLSIWGSRPDQRCSFPSMIQWQQSPQGCLFRGLIWAEIHLEENLWQTCSRPTISSIARCCWCVEHGFYWCFASFPAFSSKEPTCELELLLLLFQFICWS